MMKDLGYHVSLFGVVIILIWVGLFKYTPTESKAIEPLVSNSPFMKWLYLLFEKNVVSNIIGTIEIITGLFIIGSYWNNYSGLIGGFLASVTFALTLSFLFTTPNVIERIDGFLLPDAFILKDVMALGISMTIFLKFYNKVFLT